MMRVTKFRIAQLKSEKYLLHKRILYSSDYRHIPDTKFVALGNSTLFTDAIHPTKESIDKISKIINENCNDVHVKIYRK